MTGKVNGRIDEHPNGKWCTRCGMNHNKDRYYVFFVNSKDELCATGNIEGYINHGEAVTNARFSYVDRANVENHQSFTYSGQYRSGNSTTYPLKG